MENGLITSGRIYYKHLKVEPLVGEQDPSRIKDKRSDSVSNGLDHDPLSNVLQPAGVEGEAGLDGVVDGCHHACLLYWRQRGGSSELLNLKKALI